MSTTGDEDPCETGDKKHEKVSSLFKRDMRSSDVLQINTEFELLVERFVSEQEYLRPADEKMRGKPHVAKMRPRCTIYIPSEDVFDVGVFQIVGGLTESYKNAGFQNRESYVGHRPCELFTLARPDEDERFEQAVSEIAGQRSGIHVVKMLHNESSVIFGMCFPRMVQGKMLFIGWSLELYDWRVENRPGSDINCAIRFLNAFKREIFPSDALLQFATANLREYITVDYPKKFLWHSSLFTVKNTFLDFVILPEDEGHGAYSPSDIESTEKIRLCEFMKSVLISSLPQPVMLDIERILKENVHTRKSGGLEPMHRELELEPRSSRGNGSNMFADAQTSSDDFADEEDDHGGVTLQGQLSAHHRANDDDDDDDGNDDDDDDDALSIDGFQDRGGHYDASSSSAVTTTYMDRTYERVLKELNESLRWGNRRSMEEVEWSPLWEMDVSTTKSARNHGIASDKSLVPAHPTSSAHPAATLEGEQQQQLPALTFPKQCWSSTNQRHGSGEASPLAVTPKEEEDYCLLNSKDSNLPPPRQRLFTPSAIHQGAFNGHPDHVEKPNVCSPSCSLEDKNERSRAMNGGHGGHPAMETPPSEKRQKNARTSTSRTLSSTLKKEEEEEEETTSWQLEGSTAESSPKSSEFSSGSQKCEGVTRKVEGKNDESHAQGPLGAHKALQSSRTRAASSQWYSRNSIGQRVNREERAGVPSAAAAQEKQSQRRGRDYQHGKLPSTATSTAAGAAATASPFYPTTGKYGKRGGGGPFHPHAHHPYLRAKSMTSPLRAPGGRGDNVRSWSPNGQTGVSSTRSSRQHAPNRNQHGQRSSLAPSNAHRVKSSTNQRLAEGQRSISTTGQSASITPGGGSHNGEKTQADASMSRASDEHFFRPGDRVRLHSFTTTHSLDGLTGTVIKVLSEMRKNRQRRVRVQIVYDDAMLAYSENYPTTIPHKNLRHAYE